ncbi:MAG: hypothetical protein H6732_08455 [Alphaproteobacteria bacterium]|nr:hypothetical protein [Alphaproteobacteria bacterium]
MAAPNFLIPCCGHAVFPWPEGPFPTQSIGCDTGVEFDVVHREGEILLRGASAEARCAAGTWRAAVLGFCDQVEDLYRRSIAKVPPGGDDDAAWSSFWTEWAARRTRGAGPS